ncbi:secreted RxLR effector protein 161-like [Tasmannia lanceolata]|uniref:secreted RxLR effector protein 161-like n=1 Tax=Tasmannia lanceolata TaxID=3420 RepID=UPI004064B8CE
MLDGQSLEPRQTSAFIAELTKASFSQFNMKDLGAADTILEIKILRTKSGIVLFQSHYIEKMLKKYGYFGLSKQLDIAFVVGMLIRLTSNPRKAHWNVIQRLMRYLKATLNLRLICSGYPAMVEGFLDASWCSEPDECRSTSGFVFTLGGAAVSWKSKNRL